MMATRISALLLPHRRTFCRLRSMVFCISILHQQTNTILDYQYYIKDSTRKIRSGHGRYARGSCISNDRASRRPTNIGKLMKCESVRLGTPCWGYAAHVFAVSVWRQRCPLWMIFFLFGDDKVRDVKPISMWLQNRLRLNLIPTRLASPDGIDHGKYWVRQVFPGWFFIL